MAVKSHSNQGFASRIAGILTLGWSDSLGGRSRLRRIASRSARALLRGRSRPFSGQQIKSLLVVAPHPDDETLGCGGTMLALGAVGARMQVAFLTDGGASHPGHELLSTEKLVALRRNEAMAATRALRVDPSRVFFIDAPDGALARLSAGSKDALVLKLVEMLEKASPDAVMLTSGHDGSSDHEASYLLVQLALGRTSLRPRMLEFPIWAWRNPLLLLRPALTSRTVWRSDVRATSELKAAALDAYASQVRPIPPDKSPVLPPDFLAEFGFPEEFFFER
jgi:LmbE family N-acetylglucosaminyl deacetylase